jgi:hypothetical protein
MELSRLDQSGVYACLTLTCREVSRKSELEDAIC